MLTVWVHAHARFAICNRRVNWKTTAAHEIEKRRRKEKWQIVAKILDIENTLILNCARCTKHPSIWMSKKIDAPESQLASLYRRYYANRRRRGATVAERHTLRQQRASLVAQIRMLKRTWIIALLEAIHPGSNYPNPLPLHPTELHPRKVKTATSSLAKELA